MLKTLTTLLRGAVAEAEEAVFDANAIRVLEQQLRDAAGSLEQCKRELACAMAHQASEQRAIAALDARIADLDASARQALSAGRDDLAADAATVIAANEDERAERQAAMTRFEADVRRLRQIADDGRKRLMDLRRGLETARAQDALRRAGANGRRALASGTGALREAEATLAKIREMQLRDDDVSAALDELDRKNEARDLEERISRAGFGSRPRTKAADVLARMRSTAAPGAGTAAGATDRKEGGT